MGEVVSFPTPSGPGQGHLAIAAGPGLLPMPDPRGLTPPLVAAAQRLAAAGVATLVVDLLRGHGAWTGAFDDGVGHFLTRRLADIAADISAAAAFLLAHPQVIGDRVGIAGAGGGGAMALWAAAVSPTIACANAAYPASSLWRLEGIRPQALTGCHTVVHLADADREFTRADADRLRTTLCDPGRLEVHTHPPRNPARVPGRHSPLTCSTPPPPTWSGSGSGRPRPGRSDPRPGPDPLRPHRKEIDHDGRPRPICSRGGRRDAPDAGCARRR